MRQIYQYDVTIELNHWGLDKFVDEWCHKNLEGNWTRSNAIAFSTINMKPVYKYEFDLESDATMFTLRWL